ncbi:hypothetical protein F66182_7598 [Fusarium sp. NRRL 66182]|nr:hypothetical protein F66182_7598 [Fusarium sp. NRRL 66182]
MGSSCFVSVYDGHTVLKGYEIWVNGRRRSYYPRSCEDSLRREELIYRKLGQHPQVLQCFGLMEVHPGVSSLRLEMAPMGNLRQFIEEHINEPSPRQNRLQMALDVAVGLSYVHSRNIQHADLSCRNFFVFENYRVKIGDFGASVTKGLEFPATVCEEMRYELPLRGRTFGDRPIIKRELFALGSAIYEIMAWGKPYPDLEDDEVEERYAHGEFPTLNDPVGHIVETCWAEVYETADEVVTSLKRLAAH